jgi:hypothetical protein
MWLLRQLDATAENSWHSKGGLFQGSLYCTGKGDPIGCTMSPSKVERMPRRPRTLIGPRYVQLDAQPCVTLSSITPSNQQVL